MFLQHLFFLFQVTIGRNPDVTVCILSTMISRCHAILKKSQNGTWTIKDNKVCNSCFTDLQIRLHIYFENYFSYFSTETYAVGTQNRCLNSF